MTQNSDQSTGYLNLTNQAFATVLEAQSAWTARMLRYAQATLDVTAKPYGLATNPAAVLNENVQRATVLVELGKEEIRANGSAAAELGDKLSSHANSWQETAAQGAEELQKMFLSGLDALKERTEQQTDRFTQSQPASPNGVAGTGAKPRQRTAPRPRKRSRRA